MEKFSIGKRLKSFGYAAKGIGNVLCCEHNIWIHLIITLLVVAAGFFFDIQRGEWIALVLCIGLVLAAETFNTAIERLVDLVSPNRHPLAGEVKDIAAGAVLICAIAAAVVGLIVFIPYLF
ncbi:diacylglycerol kinase family protein [Bacteroides sp.]|uniref:diacylglycerol kinase family protein n=1 Tax=Bacteroides sp. TaxID=29523 RepID=UPI002FC6D8C8|nr:diacylglycerol kinase family protein [Bacteroides sp.]